MQSPVRMYAEVIATVGIISVFSSLFSPSAKAADGLKVGDLAPKIVAKTGLGDSFSLEARKGKWTVLYFYPKDDTPGCTKQAQAFRDHVAVIREQNAEVYGISKDGEKSHQEFTSKYELNFPLLADPEGKIIKAYGADSLFGISKRWTFIVDPDLRIRWINRNVNPAKDAVVVAEKLAELQDSAK